MAKRLIRLSESELYRAIRDGVKRAITGSSHLAVPIDIKSIPIDILRQGYFDYRLVPVTAMYGDPLRNPIDIKEAINDIADPDDVVNSIVKKYGIPHRLVLKVEHYHKIYVYSITALIGINDSLIEDDMEKMGYFLSARGQVVVIQGMRFQALQFEPSSQLQEDATDIIKNKYELLFHWTPSYNIDSIMANGIIPCHRNAKFSYPPRTYLIEGDASDEKRIFLGRMLCASNNDERNNGEYALLSVSIGGLGDGVRFFYDPNSEIGIYTEQEIPSSVVTLESIEQLRKPSK